MVHIKSNILWKILAPLVALGILLLVPVPAGMPPQAWHYFAVFIAMVIGMILEPIPATAISFIAVTVCVIGNQYLLFSASELAKPGFNASKAALKWGLAGFSSTTVWLVFGAFIFALGYEVSGLGRRIALLIVKFMGKRTLTLGYAIVIIDVLLAPFTPSNTARTGGTVFPVIRNLPPLFKSFPDTPSSRRIGGYLMWMMIISTSLSSSMFVTGSAPNVVGLGMAREIGVEISWTQWFLGFLPVGIILLIIAPWLSYILYKPEITRTGEVTGWAGESLKEMGALSRQEIILIGLVLLSLGLWVFGGKLIDAAAVGLLAISLMLLLSVVHWKDIIHYSNAWNTLVNLATLVVMANGLKQSCFLDWFSTTMSAHLAGFSPDATIVVLVLAFYFSHYLFASLTAHTTTLMPVILAIGQSIPGINLQHLCMLLVFSIGLMGCLTPYATGPGVIIYNCGYVKSKDFWRLGAIFGVIFISTLLLVGWPILTLWS